MTFEKKYYTIFFHLEIRKYNRFSFIFIKRQQNKKTDMQVYT